MSSSHKLKSDTLRLNYPLELGEKVQPVLLPDSQTVEAARTATVTGWGGVFSQDPQGGTEQQQRLSCFLQEASLEVEIPGTAGLLGDDCDMITFGNTDLTLCAIRPGVDSCQGDSGGPLFVEEDGLYTQIGIVSYGYGCASELPGVYTRLDRYTPWLHAILDMDLNTSNTSTSEDGESPTPHYEFLSTRSRSDRNVICLYLSLAVILICLF